MNSNSIKPWALVVLCLLALISPVIAESPEPIVPTGYEFEGRALYWESAGRSDSVLLSLEAEPTPEGLTTTESVAIVMKTPSGRFEVFGGQIDAGGTKFEILAYLGTVTDAREAPLLVLGWLTGRKIG